jgi:prepilin-type N-terminal cleavage/methylation domain-containing protein
MIYRRTPLNSRGFTIIELMIALSVMSVILVISTIILINLGLLYTKGTNQANTQNITRNIVNELASQLQLGTANPTISTGGSVEAICIGSQRYSYRRGHQLDASNGSDHALWRDTRNTSGPCVPFDLANPSADASEVPDSGAELLLPQMQLVDFTIDTPPTTPQGTYSIKVTVAYGDPSLLLPGNHCTGKEGTQYCAVSSLTQNITRRGVN